MTSDGVRRHIDRNLWGVFNDRICDLKTAAFLGDADLRGVIAPHIEMHCDSEIARAKAASSFNAEDMAFVRKRVQRILLTTNSLANQSGSELWTAEFAAFLVRCGFNVMIYSEKLGPVAERVRSEGIAVTNDPLLISAYSPDLVHVNHYAAAQAALARIPPEIPLVNMVHGLLPRPGIPGLEGVHAYCAVGLHAKAKTHLLTGRAWSEIELIPSSFDERRYTRREETGKNRALIFSSKTTPQQRELLADILSAHGYSIDHAGYGGVPTTDPERLLGQYELVFAVARSAVEALASGCRVILWDDGLVGPAVTDETYWKCVVGNFSMASCILPYTPIHSPHARLWLGEQLDQIKTATHAGASVRDNYAMDQVGMRVLSVYARALRERAALHDRLGEGIQDGR